MHSKEDAAVDPTIQDKLLLKHARHRGAATHWRERDGVRHSLVPVVPALDVMFDSEDDQFVQVRFPDPPKKAGFMLIPKLVDKVL